MSITTNTDGTYTLTLKAADQAALERLAAARPVAARPQVTPAEQLADLIDGALENARRQDLAARVAAIESMPPTTRQKVEALLDDERKRVEALASEPAPQTDDATNESTAGGRKR